MDIRFPAEWEPSESILLALPEKDTDWDYILEEAVNQYIRLVHAFTSADQHCTLLVHDKEHAERLFKDIPIEKFLIIECDYNDTWTRDYGSISVERNGRMRALDFGFNGWGLKFASDKDNLVNLQLKDKFIIMPETYRNERDFILEGGSVDSDGQGTILTTTRCLTSPNRNGGKTKKELNNILYHRLGAEHVLWLDYGFLDGDDTDSHIDTLARLAPNNIIIFTGCRDMDDSHFEELLKMRAQLSMFRTQEGLAYNLLELPMPSPIFDENGDRLPATYSNYLVTYTHVFMPVYNQPENDRLACQTIKVAFPDHEIIPVDCTTLIKQHGSLHCATMQLPVGILNPAITD